MSPESDMQKFYRHKTVFLTGGSGFLGKVFIEKLLRVVDVERVYCLMRSKKDKDAKQRFDELFENPLFEKLLHEKPDAPKRLFPIYGDCVLPRLGLSNEDYDNLLQNVEIVVHSAATVRFNEPLSVAVAINVQSTMALLQMAKKMPKLKAFVHVSSSFSNSYQFETHEKFYSENLSRSAQTIVDMLNDHDPAYLDSRADELRGHFINTYVFTKNLAEDAIQKEALNLPVCVVRPCITTPTYKEPMAGWTDNYYGPIGVLANVAYGALHVMQADMNKNAPTVPVDFCANLILCSAWMTAEHPRPAGTAPMIYNLSPADSNEITWNDMIQRVTEYGCSMPLNKLIWYPFITFTTSTVLYNILWFLYHTVPAFFFDLAQRLSGNKPQMMAMYPKIRKQIDVLTYFASNNWTFSIENTQGLWNAMSDKDRGLFNFNVAAIDWPTYIRNALTGLRIYLAKEQPDSIPEALKLLKKYRHIHWMFKKILQTILVYLMYKLGAHLLQ